MTDVATATELEQITRTALDYFEGWFDGDVERMDRALHPDLVKRWPGEAQDASLAVTTKERMLELTSAGRGRADAEDRRLEVEVEDVYGDIANVTVRSAVYREYLQLVRTADGWRSRTRCGGSRDGRRADAPPNELTRAR